MRQSMGKLYLSCAKDIPDILQYAIENPDGEMPTESSLTALESLLSTIQVEVGPDTLIISLGPYWGRGVTIEIDNDGFLEVMKTNE